MFIMGSISFIAFDLVKMNRDLQFILSISLLFLLACGACWIIFQIALWKLEKLETAFKAKMNGIRDKSIAQLKLDENAANESIRTNMRQVRDESVAEITAIATAVAQGVQRNHEFDLLIQEHRHVAHRQSTRTNCYSAITAAHNGTAIPRLARSLSSHI
jgi:hypothetical protein